MARLLKTLMVLTASCISSLLLASPVAPTPRTGPVSQLEWNSLVEHAKPGSVIDLGQRRVSVTAGSFRPTANVTIKGGVFSQLVLDKWRNVTFDGAVFEGAPDAPEFLFLFVADQAENVTLRNCRFTGYQAPDGELRVRGPSIRDSRNVTIERCKIENMAGFANFVRTDGGRFADNDLKTIREGLEIVGSRNIVVERNRFEDFRPFNGDHPDAVQFFTTGLTRPGDTAAQDITIRDNLIIAGGKAQGVFAGDEINLAAAGKGFARFTIDNNIVISATWHGITASEVQDVRIRNNRLLRLDGDTMDTRLAVDGGFGLVENNEANAFIYKGGKVQETGNKSRGNSSRQAVDQVIAGWMARFRKR